MEQSFRVHTHLRMRSREVAMITSLNGIIVQFDLTFTNKAWVEAERYHFLDFISSQSTMHRITKFNLDEVYISYTDPRIIEIMKRKK